MADPNMAHPQSFQSFCKSVWTICKHIFCSWLSSRTPAPTFHASPLQFFPIYSRTLFAHCSIALWHYLSHYVQLATVGLCCQSHGVHAFCLFSPCLWRTMHMRAHLCQVAIQKTPFIKLFRHTLYRYDCRWHTRLFLIREERVIIRPTTTLPLLAFFTVLRGMMN